MSVFFSICEQFQNWYSGLTFMVSYTLDCVLITIMFDILFYSVCSESAAM